MEQNETPGDRWGSVGETAVTLCGLNKDDVSQTPPIGGAFSYEAGIIHMTRKKDDAVAVNVAMYSSLEVCTVSVIFGTFRVSRWWWQRTMGVLRLCRLISI